ncbi:MAG: hypothetical protein OSA99_01050 [Acidimicrobiales bacterium]|nr:hypothetical protein [Acidimicrobiales bacterium]
MTRTEHRRAWDAAVRDAAKTLGWKTAGGGFVYRVSADTVFSLQAPAPPADGPRRGSIRAKPLALDLILWDLMGLHGLERKRTPFRVNGTFVVPLLEVDAVEYSVGSTADAVVARLHDRFEAASAMMHDCREFEPVVRAHLPPRNGFDLVTATTWLIAVDRRDEAAALLRASVDAGLRGGFSTPGASFHDLAFDHIGLHCERGHHVQLLDCRFRRIFPGVGWGVDDRLRADLERMDGTKRFALALWRVPEGADRRVPDERWESGEYVQCAGGPDRFVIEVRRSTETGPEQVALGRVGGGDELVDVPRGDHTSTVAATETFSPAETLDVLTHHVREGEAPQGLTRLFIDLHDGVVNPSQ